MAGPGLAAASPVAGRGPRPRRWSRPRWRPCPRRSRSSRRWSARRSSPRAVARLDERRPGLQPRPAQARRGELDRVDPRPHRAAQPPDQRRVRALDAGRPRRHRARRRPGEGREQRAGVGRRQPRGPGPGRRRRRPGHRPDGADLDRPGDEHQRHLGAGGLGEPRPAEAGHPGPVGRGREADDLAAAVHADGAGGDDPPHGRDQRLLRGRLGGDRARHLRLPREDPGLGRHRLQRAGRPLRHGVRGAQGRAGALGDRGPRRRLQPRDLRHRDDGRLHLGRPARRADRVDRPGSPPTSSAGSTATRGPPSA